MVVGHVQLFKIIEVGHVQTYGSRTSERGQAKLQLHVATRRWLRDLAGLEAPGYCGSVEEQDILWYKVILKTKVGGDEEDAPASPKGETLFPTCQSFCTLPPTHRYHEVLSCQAFCHPCRCIP